MASSIFLCTCVLVIYDFYPSNDTKQQKKVGWYLIPSSLTSHAELCLMFTRVTYTGHTPFICS